MLKKIAGCVREYKLVSILSPLIIAGEVIIECIIPFVTAKLIDQIESGASLSQIAVFGGITVLLALLSLTCGVLAGRCYDPDNCQGSLRR